MNKGQSMDKGVSQGGYDHPNPAPTNEGQSTDDQAYVSVKGKEGVQPDILGLKGARGISDDKLPGSAISASCTLRPNEAAQLLFSESHHGGQAVSHTLPHDPSIPSDISAHRQMLSQNAQQIVDDVNAKRKQDTQLLADFKKTLDIHVQKSCNILEQSMFQLYEQQGKIIQDKLQDLFATLDRIAKLESELQQFKQALGILYQDVQPISK